MTHAKKVTLGDGRQFQISDSQARVMKIAVKGGCVASAYHGGRNAGKTIRACEEKGFLDPKTQTATSLGREILAALETPNTCQGCGVEIPRAGNKKWCFNCTPIRR